MKTYIFLIVDRNSGRVLDAQTCNDEYSWSVGDTLTNALADHDLNNVDLVIRMPVKTSVEVEKVELEVEPSKPSAPYSDDDIPF
jgi:hypothetical protein